MPEARHFSTRLLTQRAFAKCTMVVEETLKVILIKCSRTLKWLDATGCSAISPSMVERLRERSEGRVDISFVQ